MEKLLFMWMEDLIQKNYTHEPSHNANYKDDKKIRKVKKYC
jgi:hypothetical protein